MSRFVEFRLIRQKGESEPPLGWVLSEAAKTSIDCQLLAPENLASLEQLGGLLGFEPAAFVTALRKRCSERG